MYFNNVEIFDIKKYINDESEIFAHRKDEDSKKETLKEHSDLVVEYLFKIIDEKNLENVFENIEESLLKDKSQDVKNMFKELFLNAIYMHDIGKINKNFQNVKMDNKKFKTSTDQNSKHSMLSSVIYFDYYLKKVVKFKEEDRDFLLFILLVNSYVISKHHGMLDKFHNLLDKFHMEILDFKEGFKELYEDSYVNNIEVNHKQIEGYIQNRLGKYIEEFSHKEEIYIYSKILFSLMTSCDFYATSEYINGSKIVDFGTIKDINKYYEPYKNSNIYKSLIKHKNYLEGKGSKVFEDNDINSLRSEMNIESLDKLEKNSLKNIYFLEAPTGSGKTITSINLALKTIELDSKLNKIFYIFPFNTLVEQTNQTLVEDIFSEVENIKSEVSVINSITPIKTVDENEDNKEVKYDNKKIDYKKSLLNRQFLHYPLVLTTHIGFFNYLFGNSREEVFPLVHLANSVVILDEIQSYKNHIWKEIIVFLNKYSKILNIKIIIMSATLPRLEKLSSSEDKDFCYLIDDRKKYFESELFKDRVKVDFSLLENELDINLLTGKVLSSLENKEKILVEFIKKSSAIEFFNHIKNEFENVELISGDDNKLERKKIINKVKSTDEKVILVSTQVIEAGVDIDMDIGFKDISILDSEEQFLGRINRSCKKKDSRVYFFNMDDASGIYRGDFRKEKTLTLLNDEIKDLLLNKDFENYYDKVIDLIKINNNKLNKDVNFDMFINNGVGKLNFESVKERMKLIDERKDYSVFLNTQITLENDEILNGDEVWEEYKNIVSDNKMDYSEKRIKLSEIMEKVDYFTYKLNNFTNSYSDQIGNLFYIEDGDKYFTNGKFDRSKFGEDVNHELI
ncbi:MAG: CRISPR-associated helicase Cas3' [Peptostreptococcaceae bacterium]